MNNINKLKNIKLTNKDFYFCYNVKLSKYLHENGIRFIIHAKNNDNKRFWLYQQSDTLTKKILEYRKINYIK